MKASHIISGSSNPALAEKIAKQLHLPLLKTKLSKFANQELYIRLLENCEAPIIVQSFSYPVNSHIIQTLLLSDAAKRRGASKRYAIIPYFGYSKQDKVFLEGEALSAKVISHLLEQAGFSELLTIELHNPSITGYFDIPVKNISAQGVFAYHLKSQLSPESIVISPDAGAIRTANSFANSLSLPVAHISKRRDLETGKVTVEAIDTDIEGKDGLIFDDMIVTGSTLIETAKFLKAKGIRTLTVCATHHLYLPEVQTLLDQSDIDTLYVTDTIQKPDDINSLKLHIFSVDYLVASSIE